MQLFVRFLRFWVKLYGVLNIASTWTGFNTHLPRVEQIQWINSSLDGPHQLDRAIAKFVYKILSLPDANAMLSGA